MHDQIGGHHLAALGHAILGDFSKKLIADAEKGFMHPPKTDAAGKPLKEGESLPAFIPIALSGEKGKATGDRWHEEVFKPYRDLLPVNKIRDSLDRLAGEQKDWLNRWSEGEFGTRDLLEAISKRFNDMNSKIQAIGGAENHAEAASRYRDASFSVVAALAAGYERNGKVDKQVMLEGIQETLATLAVEDKFERLRYEWGEAPDGLKMKDGESFADYLKTKIDGLPADAKKIASDIAEDLKRLEDQKPPGDKDAAKFFRARSEYLRTLAENFDRFEGYRTAEEQQLGYRTDRNPLHALRPILVEAMKVPLGLRKSTLQPGDKPTVASKELQPGDHDKIRTKMKEREAEKKELKDPKRRGAGK